MSKRKTGEDNRKVSWNENVEYFTIPQRQKNVITKQSFDKTHPKKLLKLFQKMDQDQAKVTFYMERDTVEYYLLEYFIWFTHQEAIKGHYDSDKFKIDIQYFMKLDFDITKKVFYDNMIGYSLSKLEEYEFSVRNKVLADFLEAKDLFENTQNVAIVEKRAIFLSYNGSTTTLDEQQFSGHTDTDSANSFSNKKSKNTHNSEPAANEFISQPTENIANEPSKENNIQHSNAANTPTNNHNIFLSLFVNKASINNKVDNSDTATLVLINELLEALLSLPKWLQNHTLIKSLVEAGEQLAAIYDKTINYQTLFNKKIPVDFTFTHAESNDYREDPYIDKTEGKSVTRKNSSTNEPFDTSMALEDITPLYSILPTDIGISISGNITVLGLNDEFLEHIIIA